VALHLVVAVPLLRLEEPVVLRLVQVLLRILRHLPLHAEKLPLVAGLHVEAVVGQSLLALHLRLLFRHVPHLLTELRPFFTLHQVLLVLRVVHVLREVLSIPNI